mgnify:CR=1 FL=1
MTHEFSNCDLIKNIFPFEEFVFSFLCFWLTKVLYIKHHCVMEYTRYCSWCWTSLLHRLFHVCCAIYLLCIQSCIRCIILAKVLSRFLWCIKIIEWGLPKFWETLFHELQSFLVSLFTSVLRNYFSFRKKTCSDYYFSWILSCFSRKTLLFYWCF